LNDIAQQVKWSNHDSQLWSAAVRRGFVISALPDNSPNNKATASRRIPKRNAAKLTA
jgi:hypothetical protein